MAKDMGIVGFSRLYGTLIDLIMISVLTKSLGAYGYGLWTQVLVFLPLFTMVLKFGTSFSIVRLFPEKDMEEVGTDFSSISILVSLALFLFTVGLFLFPDLLADAIFDGHIILVQILALLTFTYSLNGLFSSVFRAFREMKKLESINIAKNTAKISLIAIAVYLGYGLVGVLLSILLVLGVFSLVLFYLVRDKIPLKRPNISPLKEYLSLGLPTVPAHLAELTVIISDRYIIGLLLGATYVGYYAPAYSVGEIAPKFITGVLMVVLLPTLSDYYQEGNISKVKNVLTLSTKYFLSFAVPLIVGFIIIGKDFLTRFTTPEIASNGYVILMLSSVVGLLMGLEGIFIQGVYLKKRTKLIGIFWGIAAVLNLAGNIIFVPRIGILAAGITSILSYMVMTGFVMNFTRKKLSYSIDHQMIAKIVLSAVLMGFLLFIIRSYIWDSLSFLIAAAVSTYLFFLYLFKIIGKKEIDFLKNIST
ncbi:MAG: oligosaccharide flippase family protein [Candidatus Thermoplasmatota archaeon]